jgi:hypothetical protein
MPERVGTLAVMRDGLELPLVRLEPPEATGGTISEDKAKAATISIVIQRFVGYLIRVLNQFCVLERNRKATNVVMILWPFYFGREIATLTSELLSQKRKRALPDEHPIPGF